MPARAGMAVRGELGTYRRKRRFARTPEPSGRKGRHLRSDLTFVVQRHHASHRHYDFRLEWDGVLLSWAVPKGPVPDPEVKRLAMRVEDHPLSYADFEGVIPKGEYGGGTVMVWDRGSWIPEGDPEDGLRKGKLNFRLAGEKLSGRWTMVRTGRGSGGKRSWLLFKRSDEHARPGSGEALLEEQGLSVLTGRSMEEIADRQRVWSSRRKRGGARDARPPARPRASARRSPGSLEVADVEISNPGRVMYPEPGITKGDLARYWEVVAEAALPLLVNRPLTLLRCPGGVEKQCFFQRHGGTGTPAAVPRVAVPDKKGRAKSDPYMYVDGLPALMWLVRIGVLEFHVWNARIDRLDRPDTLVMDLDPAPDVPWTEMVGAARTLRALLLELGLPSWLRATGGKGLHVVAPIARRTGWDDVVAFARGLSQLMVTQAPDRFVATASKKVRAGKIYVDYLRNAAFASAIATFSPRARAEGTVAVPLTWTELDELDGPLRMTVAEAAAVDWAARDPWKGYGEGAPALTRAMLRAVGAG